MSRWPSSRQGEDPGGAAVDDPPPLHRPGCGGDVGLVLAVDQHEVTFAARHLGREARRGDVAGAVEAGVGDQQHHVVGDRQFRLALDQYGANQAGEDLVGDAAMVVWVVPERAGWSARMEMA